MKIDRLLSIILLLLNKEKVTAPELASYFETSVRTIYRDIETLCLSGIPIVSEQGAGGGYSLMPGFTMNKQVFKPQEILALIAGLKGMESFIDNKNIKQTFEKVSCLGGHQKETIDINFFGWGESEGIKQNVQLIYRSISNSRIISFDYTNLNGETIFRQTEPYKLFFRGSHWYLMAFCLVKNDYRFFRISRIQKLKLESGIYTPREISLRDWNPKDSITDERPAELIHLRVSPMGVSRAKEYFSSENIKEISDGYIEIKIHYPRDEWVYSYLLGYGDTVEILEPVELRDELIKRSKKFIEKNTNLTI
jgi:predicted DNA-binding transcriptional regulator YafY